jgi:hypothetical protein
MRRHDAPLCCTRLCRLSSHTASVKCPISVWRQASRTIFSPIQHSFPPHTHKQAAATCVQYATVLVSVRVLRPTSYTFLLQILSLCMAVAAASALQQAPTAVAAVSAATGPYGSCSARQRCNRPLRQWRYGSLSTRKLQISGTQVLGNLLPTAVAVR